MNSYLLYTVLCLSALCDMSRLEHSPIYVDDGAGRSVSQEEISPEERAEIQQELLYVLGLRRRPRPAQLELSGSASSFLLDIYRSMVDDDETGDLRLSAAGVGDAWNDFNISTADADVIDQSDVLMSFVNHGSKHHRHMRFPRSQLLWYDLSEVPQDDNRLATTLRVYQGVWKPDQDTHGVVLHIHQLVKDESGSIEPVELDRRELDPDYVGWMSFNVTRAAETWRASPDYNLGLYMQVTSADGEELLPAQVGVVDSFGDQARLPFMTAFFRQHPDDRPPPPPPRRSKRSLKKRRRSGGHSRNNHNYHSPLKHFSERPENRVCQKHNLYVSFKDLGWQEWIIAPDGYAAFFCAGLCAFPLNSHLNATNHAIVQTLTHLLDPYDYPKPMCAPTKLNSISVLYFDDNSNVVLKKYSNMVASSCGCH